MTLHANASKARAQANARIAALMQAVQKQTDAAVAKRLPPNTTCTRGCAGCCRQLVPIAGYEATLLVHKQRNAVRAALPVLQEQAERFEAMAPELPDSVWDSPRARDEVATQWWDQNQRCAFLTAQNDCGIYEHRPLVCRMYFALSDPKHCFSEQADPECNLIVAGVAPPSAATLQLRKRPYVVGPLQKMVLRAWKERA